MKQTKEHEKAGAGSPAGREKAGESTAAPAAEQAPGNLEKSVAVLSKLKELEFHSRANIETLAELSLTIDDELKQKEFSDPVGGLYSAQDQFQTRIMELIENYEAHVEGLKPSA